MPTFSSRRAGETRQPSEKSDRRVLLQELQHQDGSLRTDTLVRIAQLLGNGFFTSTSSVHKEVRFIFRDVSGRGHELTLTVRPSGAEFGIAPYQEKTHPVPPLLKKSVPPIQTAVQHRSPISAAPQPRSADTTPPEPESSTQELQSLQLLKNELILVGIDGVVTRLVNRGSERFEVRRSISR